MEVPHRKRRVLEKALQGFSLIILDIEATTTPAGKFKKGSKKGQNRSNKRTEKDLSALKDVSFISTVVRKGTSLGEQGGHVQGNDIQHTWI